ncbi:MAG TPA: hypothetical protein VK465_15960, partial [Fibrobacteria bacterium]|nr:hypothetical protein [Fibrobacteria bacterium]
RLHPASGGDGIRRDASALSLSLGAMAPEGREWALQVLHQRLEAGADPAAASAGTILGAGFSLPGGTGAGAAASLFAGGKSGRLRPGAYAEAALEGGKSGCYLLRARQASPGWSNALSGTPSRLRDTVEGGLILPGRGEGSLEARSRLPLAGLPGPGKDPEAPRAWLEAAGGAAWTLGVGSASPLETEETLLADAPPWLSNPSPSEPAEDVGYPDMRLLAGEGRASLHLARSGWTGAGHAALRLNASDRTASGMSRAYGLSGGHARESWRFRASLACRAAAAQDLAWPLALEAAWRAPSGHSAAAGLTLGDAARPGRGARLTVRQKWRLGSGARLSQALRLPWRSGELGEGMGFQLRLEWSPAKG